MYEHPLHACGLRHPASVLACSAAKTKQRELGASSPWRVDT